MTLASSAKLWILQCFGLDAFSAGEKQGNMSVFALQLIGDVFQTCLSLELLSLIAVANHSVKST